MPRPDTSRENGKLGGRPKGSISKKRLEQLKVLAALRQRTMRNADIIYDAQMHIAKGVKFLYRIDKEWIATGKDRGYWKKLKPVLVEGEEEIRAYLENRTEDGDENDAQDPAAAYYYITVKEPNNQAIDSMLDRVFGRSKTIGEIDVNLRVPKPLLDKLPVNKSDKKNIGA